MEEGGWIGRKWGQIWRKDRRRRADKEEGG